MITLIGIRFSSFTRAPQCKYINFSTIIEHGLFNQAPWFNPSSKFTGICDGHVFAVDSIPIKTSKYILIRLSKKLVQHVFKSEACLA